MRVVVKILNLTAEQVADLVGLKDARAVKRWTTAPTSKTHAQPTMPPGVSSFTKRD